MISLMKKITDKHTRIINIGYKSCGLFFLRKYVVSSSILIQIPAKGHLTCNSDQIRFYTLVYPADLLNKIGKLRVCTYKDSLLPKLTVLPMINNLQILNLVGHFRLDTQFLLETQL